MSKLTKLALQRQSYEWAQTLPSVEALGVVEAGGQTRARLIVFNQRETPYRVNCVKCYRFNPKSRSLSNWFRSKLGPFDWDYSRENTFWNPKGPLDDEERYSQETLPFTLVNDKEILLVTLSNFSTSNQYRFEVLTSQGTAIWEGILPNEKTALPHEHSRTIY